MFGERDIDSAEKAKALDNYAPLDVHTWSDHPEVNAAVSKIYGEMRGLYDFKGHKEPRKRHIKVVILDLYTKWLRDPSMYTSYYRGGNHYKPKSRYNTLNISKLTPHIVDSLVALGYVEHHVGHYDRTGFKQSHMSRMRATPKLIGQITDRHGIVPAMIDKAPNSECIILRTGDPTRDRQVDIEYKDTPDTIRMREELYHYNNVLWNNYIAIPFYAEDSDAVSHFDNQNDKFVRRIFNNGRFDHGGRFYGGWWQRIPKENRKEIRINNMPTIEVDYSGLHIIILYQLVGIDFWKDVGVDPYLMLGYGEDGQTRNLLKPVLITLINSASVPQAIKSVRKEIHWNKAEYGWVLESGLRIEDIIQRFLEAHRPIAVYCCSGYGVRLQYIDSLMAEHVINTFSDAEEVVLCVHDSFIVQVHLTDNLKEAMHEGYLRALRIDNPDKEIKLKSTMLNRSLEWSGPYLHDRKSVVAYRSLETGDKDYDARVQEYDLSNGYENYYPDHFEEDINKLW